MKGGLAGIDFLYGLTFETGLGCCAGWHGAEATVESEFSEGGREAVEWWVCSRLRCRGEQGRQWPRD